MKQHIKEIDRALFYTKKACESTMHADSGEELRVAWESFVDNYGKTIDRLISAGLSNPSTKGWAHRLKQKSTKDDDGLQYMREARNVSQHGLAPFGSYEDPKVTIGSSIALIGGVQRNITISNITENGRQIVGDPITFDQYGGRVQNLKGERPAAMREMPAEVRLGAISNPDKKKTVGFPATICGRRVTYGSPRSLARAAVDSLDEIVQEFKKEVG